MQMFIKKRFKINKNGEKKYGYSMYHSKRINGKPRRFTVLNLGTDFAVPEEYWKLLSDHVVDQLANGILISKKLSTVKSILG